LQPSLKLLVKLIWSGHEFPGRINLAEGWSNGNKNVQESAHAFGGTFDARSEVRRS